MQIIDNFLEKHRTRVIGLDILRVAAIFIVVYGHGILLLPQYIRESYTEFQILKLDGVSIFFVLSGFLIGKILLKKIDEETFFQKDLLNFWIRRWFRTIPNYLFVLLSVAAYRIFILDTSSLLSLDYFLFLQNFASPHPVLFPEGWSLAVEEWFYLLLPVCCYILIRFLKNKSRSILISAVIFIIVPVIFRIIKYELSAGVLNFESEFRTIVIFRLDSLMYGVLAAYICYKKESLWINNRFKFLSIGLFLTAMFGIFNLPDLIYKPLIFNLESITVFFLLPYLSQLKTTGVRGLDSSIIFFSIISYSMYLLNLTPVQGYFIPLTHHLFAKSLIIENVFIINYLLYWLYTIIAACALYYFYENPLTKLRDRFSFQEFENRDIAVVVKDKL